MTADPHTMHSVAENESARLQGPMCLGTEQHQKFIWNSKLETSTKQITSSVYKEMALEIIVHRTEEE